MKTLAIADVRYDEQGNLRLEHASAISRLTDAETFATETLLEVHRRGLDKADEVCAVQDGAKWLQGLVDYHRSDALRVLDFPHAAEYVTAIGEMLQGAECKLPKKWLERQLHKLKHQGPKALLTQLHQLLKRYSHPQCLEKKIAYLERREMQMQYPQCQTAGWPIGSGMVESANKLVVEARMKGAGMHWEPANVNPMLAVRNAVCNDRFEELWKKSRIQQKEQRKRLRQQHREERYQLACFKLTHLFLTFYLSHPNALATTVAPRHSQQQEVITQSLSSTSSPLNPNIDLAPSHPSPSVSHRPAANHPWRKPFLKRSSPSSVSPQQAGAKI